jgi:hypothetical protein
MIVRRDVDAYFVIIITEVLPVVANFVKLHFVEVHISSVYDFILVVDKDHIAFVAKITKDASAVFIFIVNHFLVRDK